MEFEDTVPQKPMDGGKKGSSKGKGKTSTASKYVKTAREYKDKCGIVRRVYECKGSFYVKKRSAKTGKFSFYKVKSQ